MAHIFSILIYSANFIINLYDTSDPRENIQKRIIIRHFYFTTCILKVFVSSEPRTFSSFTMVEELCLWVLLSRNNKYVLVITRRSPDFQILCLLFMQKIWSQKAATVLTIKYSFGNAPTNKQTLLHILKIMWMGWINFSGRKRKSFPSRQKFSLMTNGKKEFSLSLRKLKSYAVL